MNAENKSRSIAISKVYHDGDLIKVNLWKVIPPPGLCHDEEIGERLSKVTAGVRKRISPGDGFTFVQELGNLAHDKELLP